MGGRACIQLYVCCVVWFGTEAAHLMSMHGQAVTQLVLTVASPILTTLSSHMSPPSHGHGKSHPHYPLLPYVSPIPRPWQVTSSLPSPPICLPLVLGQAVKGKPMSDEEMDLLYRVFDSNKNGFLELSGGCEGGVGEGWGLGGLSEVRAVRQRVPYRLEFLRVGEHRHA
jgi:hypothetical protein